MLLARATVEICYLFRKRVVFNVVHSFSLGGVSDHAVSLTFSRNKTPWRYSAAQEICEWDSSVRAVG